MFPKVCKLVFAAIIVLLQITNSFENDQGWVYNADGCRTPDRGVGNCMVIKKCKSMTDFLQQAPHLTSEIINLIRSYKCGFAGKSVKVCCPNTPILLNFSSVNTRVPPVPVTPTTSVPPNNNNHKNLHLLPLGNCGPYPSNNRITNGNKTELGEFPWMALLSYKTRTGSDFRCGGTLISNRYILTAAHCLTHLDNISLIGIRLGEYNISSDQDCQEKYENEIVCAQPVQDIYVEEIIPHPNYNSITYANDIGLVRLGSPAIINEGVQPICLPSDESMRNKNFTNVEVVVTGWGSTGAASIRSEDLLKVGIYGVSEVECKAAYNESQVEINYRQLCAGGRNKKDSCKGDSGGPLQMAVAFDGELIFVQYGVVSFGPTNCGLEHYPGVYTRVDYYMDWILDNMHT